MTWSSGGYKAEMFDQELDSSDCLSVSVCALPLFLPTTENHHWSVLFYYAILHLLSAAIPRVKLFGPYGIDSVKRSVWNNAIDNYL